MTQGRYAPSVILVFLNNSCVRNGYAGDKPLANDSAMTFASRWFIKSVIRSIDLKRIPSLFLGLSIRHTFQSSR
jgi:hypothetical protein